MRGLPLRLLKQVIKALKAYCFDTPGHRRAVRRIPLKAPRWGTPPATHSVSTSPIAARTRKHRHSRQTSWGARQDLGHFSASNAPMMQDKSVAKCLPPRKGLQASFATSKTSENRAQTLQKRVLGLPKSSPEASKTPCLKNIYLKKAPREQHRSFWRPK